MFKQDKQRVLNYMNSASGSGSGLRSQFEAPEEQTPLSRQVLFVYVDIMSCCMFACITNI